MIKRVAITGPESSGKTELACYLADRFRDMWVPEFSREYLAEMGLSYRLSDIEAIARGQFQREEQMISKAKKYLFCDTDFTVTKIWSEVVFSRCPEWIDLRFNEDHYDLYLLCYPDLPWKPDPLRQNPDNRKDLFLLYQKALVSIGANFRQVDGVGDERTQKAISFVLSL